MVLQELGGGGFDYVQDTTPSAPDIGETWFDESETDVTKRSKIYADVGNGAEWVVIPSLEQVDILSDGTPFRGDAVPDTGTIPNTDQVGQGVDWSAKTNQYQTGTITTAGNDLFSVSGSGYLLFVGIAAEDQADQVRITVDGDDLVNDDVTRGGGFTTNDSAFLNAGMALSSIIPFSTSLSVGGGATINGRLQMGVHYVLD